ncbi:FdhF/YdeP family oxidoreductase [Kineococcus gynurae]|uniref:FdhF/YdeP family oxidoreductase n=1 Tax=Kineococcus gynurae TaxID=452979 RepID=A0ABV5LX25_9ACTN
MSILGRVPAPTDDVDESKLHVSARKHYAAGVPAVAVAMQHGVQQMGVRRTAQTLLRLNQVGGFDCQGCAWPDPDPDHRHTAEFCENGAKAVAEEATLRRVTREFFARHSVDDLVGRTDYWLGQQGRLTEPMVKRPGSRHYEPVSYDEAFRIIGAYLNSLPSPDAATFYTSGRTSNEAAFAYQLFVRAFGTNNLPDCSNMCHESTSVALGEVIGIGKGSVHLRDFSETDLILVVGQNPGTNHPRMLSALEQAKKNGARIIAVNPLPEAGLLAFKNPQTPKGLVKGQGLTDLFLPIRGNGDLALFQWLGRAALRAGKIDREFVESQTSGFDDWARHVEALDEAEVLRATGLSRVQLDEAARMLLSAKSFITCWAMGVTQHVNAVGTIKEIVNLHLATGAIGLPGSGLCPVRGHSNVQGDRTMGIWERAPQHFLDAIRDEFGFDPPREHGHDVVDSIRAMAEGKIRFFLGMGGNFIAAAPDTAVTENALASCGMTVQVSTKLNRSHAVCGETAIILPTLGRTERDVRQGVYDQFVTVEDSMSEVHASRGRLAPPAPGVRSEVQIVSGIAAATLAGREDATGTIDWSAFAEDYSVIRDHISRVVPGCEDYDAKVRRPGGFQLPHPPRDTRTFDTPSGKAQFGVVPLQVLELQPGQLLLQTMRSHDQYNTTIYGLEDRYRGIHSGRRVVFLSAADAKERGFADGDVVDLIGVWDDDVERIAPAFRVVVYDIARGCAAAYYPETNPLVPLDSTAEASNTPTSKGVVVTLRASTTDPTTAERADIRDVAAEFGDLDADKRAPETTHLS